jgi:hypothetical protein
MLKSPLCGSISLFNTKKCNDFILLAIICKYLFEIDAVRCSEVGHREKGSILLIDKSDKSKFNVA